MSKEKSKYKVGDKVLIKESSRHWTDIKGILVEINHIVTIKKVKKVEESDKVRLGSYYYMMKEVRAYWFDSDIEKLFSEPEKFPELESTNRFELMDL